MMLECIHQLFVVCDRPKVEIIYLFAQGFHVVFTAKTLDLHVVEKDPDDNKFIECAVALKAGFVITGDKALIDIEDYMAIKIISPTDFLSIYRKTGH